MSSPTRRALPNAITLGRLVLAVAFFIMLARLDRTADADEVAFEGFWAGICFAVAAATDLLPLLFFAPLKICARSSRHRAHARHGQVTRLQAPPLTCVHSALPSPATLPRSYAQHEHGQVFIT